MKKKFLYLVLFFAFVSKVHAQNPYLNEWIDYSKTYYKFKLGPVFGYDASSNPIRKGVVRITQPVLAAAGLGSVPAEQFQLWRDGKEVPLYITTTTGILGSGDYIEFWGEIANGETDTYLYSDSSYQTQNISCLETDSAAYFLTVNPGTNKRFTDAVNDVSNVTIPAEKNFMYFLPRYYRGFFNGGYGIFLEEKLYASSYDIGEGFLSRPIHNNSSTLGNTQLPWTFSNMYVDTSGGPSQADVNVVGSAPNDRSVNVILNNDTIAQVDMSYFSGNKLTIPNIPTSLIANNTAAFVIQNVSTVNDDEIRVGKIAITYPHKYNFENASTFEFYVNASSTGRYLKIANFNRGTATPVLYDLTNGKRYIGNTSITDTIQFLLPASVDNYHLVLVRGDGSTAASISSLTQRNFVDYAQPANQGNYLIITNPVLLGTAPNDYIQQYSDYRNSDSGGHYNSKIIDIHQLEDQFANGIAMHPLAIKNFLRYARKNFSEQPKYAFLIGKAVTYDLYRQSETNSLTYQLQLVPTFGSPGSDNLLASEDYDPTPATPIGRLSVVKSSEVGIYLSKVKEYEAAQKDTTSSSIEEKLWMKKVLQLAGANDPSIQSIIDTFQENYKSIISDTLFGANVSIYNKSITEGGAYAEAVQDFTNQYNDGSAMVEYLGHSSSTSIDFNLDNPSNYTNTGKYPLFIVNGCLAGNIFDYDANRLNLVSTLSEKFVLAPGKGSIGYLSSTSFGVLSYLDIFTQNIYKSITSTQYGNGFGNIMHDAIVDALGYTGTSDFYGLMHAEQLAFHGDPAIKLNYFSNPDFALDSAGITASPDYLTVASDSFTVKLKLYNIGKAISDSVHLKLTRTYPNGSSDVVFSKKIAPVYSEDSISFTLPIVANRDKGTTIITASIDDDNKFAELHENNNTTSVKVHISAADLLPVSPYNYSIVTSNNVDLVASTAYAFDSLTQYVMELDTTALFNSPIKTSMQYVSTGGVIEFKNVNLSLNNTVYYWRVSEDSIDKHWNSFSFIYRDAANAGFEQAHFYQHTQSTFKNVSMDSTSRTFNFGKEFNNLYIVQSVYPTSGNEDAQFSIALNGTIVTWSACVGHSIMFNVFDPKTLKPVLDSTRPYGAGPTDCKDTMSRYNFEYSTQDTASRKHAMDFLDNFVQNGYYVVARKIYDLGDADWAPTVWAKDTVRYGHNNSLYHRLKDQGTLIDSFISPRTFIFVFKKNDSANYKPVSVLSQGIYDRISLSQNIMVTDSVGTVTSPKYGPATSWGKVKWSGTNTNSNNRTHLNIYATDKNGNDTLIYTIPTSQAEQDISSLDASKYPYVKLQMDTRDSLTQIPYQLQDWSAEFTPVPEGAVATSLGYNIPSDLVYDHDINTQLDTLNGYIIFKNISSSGFSPLKVNIVLYDSANNAHSYTVPRTRSLPAGDTLYIPFSLDVSSLPQGTYNLFIDVNPDNDQPEQYHYNNTLYHYVNITRNFVLASHQFILSAKPVNKAVQLQWTVANELNVASYEVEFSADGRTFKSIGMVNATASTASLKDYSFLHTGPVNGNNFYRIKMIDKDGSVLYSNIRLVQMSLTNVVVYPNPFRSKLNVLLKDNTKPAIIKVIDVNGRVIMQQTASGSVTLSLGNLSAGMYILQVNDGTAVQSFKVYKQ